ncbi:MAG TPA: oxygenase MpaB family protein [Candidatus Limnocylindrales bacterium]|nr:oxygenase MpaB family protein [Candidatus Limnocylindrales bacterium]
MAGRGVLDEIEGLDPEKDFERICYLSTNYDFPWDVEQSLSLAFFKTYGIPTISELLDRTGEFRERAQKRYDDTKLILAEMFDHGIDSERGREANRRMNQMHGRFPIPNDDYLHVMSTIVLEPIRWNRRWGWRKYTDKESQAQFAYMREMARRMNISNVPPTLDSLEQWSLAYEAANFRFAESNRRVADYTLNLFLSWFSRPARPLVRRAMLAILDDALLEAFGYERPGRVARTVVDLALRTRGFVIRFSPRRRSPHLVTREPMRSYPLGYRLSDLGVADLPSVTR